MTFLERRRLKPGLCGVGSSFFSSTHGGGSSRPSHLAMLNRCCHRDFCSSFSDLIDSGGEGRAAIAAAIEVKVCSVWLTSSGGSWVNEQANGR